MANEQPMTKRQKIDNRNGNHNNKNEDESTKDLNTSSTELLICGPSTSQHNKTNNQLTTNTNIPNSITSSPASSHNSSTDEVDKCTLQLPTVVVHALPTNKEITEIKNKCNLPSASCSGSSSSSSSGCISKNKGIDSSSTTSNNDPSSCSSSRSSSTSSGCISKNKGIDLSTTTSNNDSSSCSSSSRSGCISKNKGIDSNTTSNNDPSSCCSSKSGSNNNNDVNEMAEFEEYLLKQCLCGVNENILRKPFESHYSYDKNGLKRIINLNEWPTNKLLQFLSNLQLLFDIYLKQNNQGFICSRIMDICDVLIRNEHKLIDEIIELGNFNNKYIQYISGRVLASFLVIAKNHMNDNWLKKLVDNLFVNDIIDFIAIRKIHFSLDIIKRIVEWKDIDIHPLEDELNHHNAGISPPYPSPHTQQQSLENNYFAVHFNNEMLQESNQNAASSSSSSAVASSSNVASGSNNLLIENNHNHKLITNYTNINRNCHLITLTDSESFDTTNLKCLTIKILENKWPALVKNMSHLILTHYNIKNAEYCILTFLLLWENIISVKANLSIIETLPFYSQLNQFELLLLNTNISYTIYKQILNLFNESLCYGSTLALQDLLPNETCLLAHQIVKHIKDNLILNTIPTNLQYNNHVSLIGYKGNIIEYNMNSLYHYQLLNSQHNQQQQQHNCNDKILLQKLVLLILKSIAIIIKEIRNDSSDSSVDSNIDYDIYQDIILIEYTIRDVLKKLQLYIKNVLELHPEYHFSKILIYLFNEQDDYLIESMVCTLDIITGITIHNNNMFNELINILNPILIFLEFLKMISYSTELLLDLLINNETCFLLYLLRFLKYIRSNWSIFINSCYEYDDDIGGNINILDNVMTVLIRLRLQINRLVSKQLYPYDISPVLRLLESCESLYEGNELS